jgi:hypothetical protein
VAAVAVVDDKKEEEEEEGLSSRFPNLGRKKI